MKKMATLRGALFFTSILGGILFSHASDADCAKLTSDICQVLKKAKADSDTFSVSINFFPPAKDTSDYCKNLDPKNDPDGRCYLSGYDSAYYAKLKADAQT